MAKFTKGQSGNPAGRPKIPHGLSMKKELVKQLADVDPGTGKLNIEVIVAAWVRRGKRGEPKALEMIADRIDGKVTQPIAANVNVSREKRLASIEELLTLLPVPEDNGARD